MLALTLVAQPAHGSGAEPDAPSSVPSQLEAAIARPRLAALGAPPLPVPATMMIENRRVLSYPFEQVWPTAIRYLRIDRGYEVTEHDEEAGYMLFEFPLEGARFGSGSLEMFRTEDAAGRPSVSVAVNTGAGPVHLPNTILDGIAAKVRTERGQPVAPPKHEEPPPEQDEPEDEDHSVPLLPPAQDP